MQTFLPYPDFAQSAASLDRQRLGKQRVETYQLLKALNLRRELKSDNQPAKGRWMTHTAARMWYGYERCLVIYGRTICEEWMSRGYKDSCLSKIENYWDLFEWNGWPHWLGDTEFHRSHQSNLIYKNPGYYASQFPGVPDDYAYIWPEGLT